MSEIRELEVVEDCLVRYCLSGAYHHKWDLLMVDRVNTGDMKARSELDPLLTEPDSDVMLEPELDRYCTLVIPVLASLGWSSPCWELILHSSPWKGVSWNSKFFSCLEVASSGTTNVCLCFCYLVTKCLYLPISLQIQLRSLLNFKPKLLQDMGCHPQLADI